MTPSNSLFLARTTNAAFARLPSTSFSTCRHPEAKTLSCFSLIFLKNEAKLLVIENAKGSVHMFGDYTNLIDGGVPAGIKIPPGEEGCRTKRSKIRTITRHGNSKTNPKGIEIDELPFKRILLLKNANLEMLRPFSRETSSTGRLGEEGSHFEIRCVNPMGARLLTLRRFKRD